MKSIFKKFRDTDPHTSYEAAQRVKPKITSREKDVLHLLQFRRPMCGLTASGIANALNMRLNTVSSMMVQMIRKGYVMDSGWRRKGDTNSFTIVYWPTCACYGEMWQMYMRAAHAMQVKLGGDMIYRPEKVESPHKRMLREAESIRKRVHTFCNEWAIEQLPDDIYNTMRVLETELLRLKNKQN